MRRKHMMVALFLGALTLGACVENEESASVTNVREAKAEQLKSVAAMNNAEAQAKLIFANAEAALKAAQADAEKANAEKTRAEIEIAKKQAELIELQKEAAKLDNEAAVIENKKKQAELEGQLALLEVTKKEAEASLKMVADNMAKQEQKAKVALADLQLKLKKAEQALLDYDQGIADAKTEAEKKKLEAEKRELQKLSTKYSNAILALIGVQKEMSGLKNELVLLNNGLMTMEEAKAQSIATKNNQIAFNKNKIEAYKKYTNYTEDVEALYAQLKQIDIDLLPLKDKWNVASDKYNAFTVDNNAINKAAESIYADQFFKFMQSRNGYSVEDADGNFTWVSTYPFNKYIRYDDNGKNNLKSTATMYEHKVGEDVYAINFGNTYSIDYHLVGDPRDLDLDVNNSLAQQNSELKMYNGWLDGSQKQYNGKAVNWEGKAIRNAVDSTLYLKKAYDAETDQVKKDKLLGEYRESLENEQRLASNISDYKGYVASAEKEIARINTQYAMYKDAAKLTQALQVKIDACNKTVAGLYVGKVALWKERINAQVAYNAKEDEKDAINVLLNGGPGQTLGAEHIKSLIGELEQTNIALEKANADVFAITTQKETIAYKEAEIKAKEAIVTAKEIAVSDAKAALDAAMKNVQ